MLLRDRRSIQVGKQQLRGLEPEVRLRVLAPGVLDLRRVLT
jgi:hypothetical protein